MAPKPSNQHSWTLRFKNYKTTILLLVQQTQSFSSIKKDLLEAIQATGIASINGEPLPSDPEDIILGVPIDGAADAAKGWINLDIPEFDEEPPRGKGVKKGSVLNQSPLGAGLKDGDMLAFRFGKEGEGGDDGMDLDDGWEVVIPSYEEEDAAAAANQGLR